MGIADVAGRKRWGATVNKTAGDAEKLDDVVFPLFPQGGGFPRNNDDKT